MKKLLVGIFTLFALNASAQFIPGQVLKSSDLNAALAAPTITGGSINGAPIGQSVPAAVGATTLTATTANLGGGASTGAVFKAHAAANSNLEILTPNSGSGVRLFARDDAGTLNRLELQGGTVVFPLTSGADGLVYDASSGKLTLIGSGINALGAAPFIDVTGSIANNDDSRGYRIFAGAINIAGSVATATTGEYRHYGGFEGWGGYQTFYTNGVERVRIDSHGNLGLGVTPSAWGGGIKAFDLAGIGSLAAVPGGVLDLVANAYYNGTNWIYSTTGNASYMAQTAGQHLWYTAPSGTAGNPITWTQAMTLDASGNLLVGVTTGSNHKIVKAVTADAGSAILSIENGGGQGTVYFYGVSGGGIGNAANAAMRINSDAGTGRSINANGTINASGADYAEYMRKAAGVGELAKGQIVGVDSDGNLTDRYSAAVSFLIVSTDPSYIGGDTWGSEKALGMAHPVKPERKPGESASDYDKRKAQYLTDKAKFDGLLALAQSRVAIIAYAGQVPVNVKGGKPGQYVIPVRGKDDTIAGRFVDAASMTFQQYRAAVGIVQNVLPDRRANVRVKVL